MNDKLQFTPNVVVARVGTLTLTIKNLGVVPHNLVYDTDGLGRTSSIAGGASQDLKTVFSKAGTYTFTCTFHAGMDGRVVVS
jgi:plastocyanin